MAEATAQELESFRRQWQEEVRSRTHGQSSAASNRHTNLRKKVAGAGPALAHPPQHHVQNTTQDAPNDWEYGYHDLENVENGHRLGDTSNERQSTEKHEPASALEHYERAVERETQGSLGDSLQHYRKAYRLDAGVDKAYKTKHFPNPPPPIQKPTSPNPSNAPVTVPNPAHHSLADAPGSISNLIASFAAVSIAPEEPPTDASPPAPSPISTIPPELLTHILLQTALLDPASFARLSLVCKRLAYIVATDDRIWQRICLSPTHGFPAMHYTWACNIIGQPLHDLYPPSIHDLDLQVITTATNPPRSTMNLTNHSTYKAMYHTRHRIRFSGCYISTVNYIRPGAATASQATWNSPVLIVTYYRYLRFFRDGSCISLLTTAEPREVVHQLQRENIGRLHAQGLPGAVMNHALRGRWKLSGDAFGEKKAERNSKAELDGERRGEKNNEELVTFGDRVSNGLAGALEPDTKVGSRQGDRYDDEEEEEEEEGIVHIETEGADAGAKNPKYVYKMVLALQSAGGGGSKAAGKTRNNKMAWLGYWSYNKLSDDWAEFGLKNDKPFFWSRVRSYGNGE